MNVLEIVNNKIIEKLENGVNPWIKPWNDGIGGYAYNAKENKFYQGINQFLLPNTAYMTFKQIVDLGGKLKKGAKAEMVVFSAPKEKKEIDENGEEVVNKFFILKYFNVFNVEDIENVDEIKVSEKTKNLVKVNNAFKVVDDRTIEEADKVVEAYLSKYNIKFEYSLNNGAYFNYALNKITLPYKKQFKNIKEYYSTVFHELAHSTGLTLKRELGQQLEKYSKEELIAEITAVLCLNYLGIDSSDTNNNSVAYLKSWASRLKEQNKKWLIINATTEAEKAFKLIFNLE